MPEEHMPGMPPRLQEAGRDRNLGLGWDMCHRRAQVWGSRPVGADLRR